MITACFTSSGTFANICVSVAPGATQLTVMLFFAHSRANVRVRPTTPAFDAE